MKNLGKAIGYFAVYFLVQFLMQSAFMMAAAFSKGYNTEAGMISYSSDRILLITILSNLLLVVMFALYFKVRKRKVAEEVRAVKVPLTKYILPLELAFSFSFVWALVTYDVTFDNSIMLSRSAAFYSEKVPFLGTVLMVIALLISAPVTEEFICRGILISKLENSYSSIVAVIITSLIFGVMHLMAGGVVLAVGAALMGAVFGIIFVKTKSLLPAIAAHMAANLPDFILPLFGDEMNGYVRWGMMVVFAVVFVVCLVKFLREQENGTKGA